MKEAGSRILLIANENAGNKKTEKKVKRFVRAVERRGLKIDVVRTKTPDQARETILNSIGNYDRLCTLGGDGTLRLAVETILQSGRDSSEYPTIFPKRGGSINLLEKATGHYITARGAARLLEHGVVYDIDAVKVKIDGGKENGGSEMFFVSNASLGLSGQLFNSVNRFSDNSKGGLIGYLPGIPEVIRNARSHDVDVAIDGRNRNIERLTEMVVVNAGDVGIVPFGPEETYDGNNLLVITFNGPHANSGDGTNRANQLNAKLTFRGAVYDLFHPGKASRFEERTHARSVKIDIKDGQEIKLQLDGDGVGVAKSSIEFEIYENAFKILTRDQSKPRFNLIRRRGRAFTQSGEKVSKKPQMEVQ